MAPKTPKQIRAQIMHTRETLHLTQAYYDNCTDPDAPDSDRAEQEIHNLQQKLDRLEVELAEAPEE